MRILLRVGVVLLLAVATVLLFTRGQDDWLIVTLVACAVVALLVGRWVRRSDPDEFSDEPATGELEEIGEDFPGEIPGDLPEELLEESGEPEAPPGDGPEGPEADPDEDVRERDEELEASEAPFAEDAQEPRRALIERLRER